MGIKGIHIAFYLKPLTLGKNSFDNRKGNRVACADNKLVVRKLPLHIQSQKTVLRALAAWYIRSKKHVKYFK